MYTNQNIKTYLKIQISKSTFGWIVSLIFGRLDLSKQVFLIFKKGRNILPTGLHTSNQNPQGRSDLLVRPFFSQQVTLL